MFGLRSRFLNSASFLLDRPNEGDGGGAGTDDPNTPAAVEAADAGSDGAGDENGADGDGDAAGDEDGAAGDEDDDPDGSSGDEDGDEDDDELLADLTPEQRAKVERRLAKETGWRDRQIDRLYRQKRETAEDRDALEVIATRQPAAPGAAAVPQTPEEVQIAARQLVAKDRYDEACNNAYTKGTDVYKDRWNTALSRLPKLGGVDQADMQNIVATDNPHVVLFELSKPETYERVMALPPARRLTEFVKLSLVKAPKATSAAVDSKRPSAATPPVTPIAGGRRVAARQVNLNDDRVSDEQWYAERNRTRRKKFSEVQ